MISLRVTGICSLSLDRLIALMKLYRQDVGFYHWKRLLANIHTKIKDISQGPGIALVTVAMNVSSVIVEDLLFDSSSGTDSEPDSSGDESNRALLDAVEEGKWHYKGLQLN